MNCVAPVNGLGYSVKQAPFPVAGVHVECQWIRDIPLVMSFNSSDHKRYGEKIRLLTWKFTLSWFPSIFIKVKGSGYHCCE